MEVSITPLHSAPVRHSFIHCRPHRDLANASALVDGRVFSFGRNNYGELGLGDLEERRTPTLVPGLEGIGSSPS